MTSICPEDARPQPSISLEGDESTLSAAWARLAQTEATGWIRWPDDEAQLSDMLDAGDALLAFYSDAFRPSVLLYLVRHDCGIRVDGFVPSSTMPPASGWRSAVHAAILDEIVLPIVDALAPALRLTSEP